MLKKIVKRVVQKKKEAAPPPPILTPPKKEVKKVVDPLIRKKVKKFGIGQDIQPKRDLTRYVRWPRYIRVQRQRAILYQRIKVPPPINQFRSFAVDRQTATQLFRLLDKYRPETKKAKKLRLKKLAKEKASGKEIIPKKRPPVVNFGTNKVTTLVEQKKASLVVIAADVDPIEIVLHLPALCRKMGVPFCIVKGGRSRLGVVVNRKSIASLCLTNVNPEDKNTLAKLCEVIKTNFNDRFEEMKRQWGGGQVSNRSKAKMLKLEKAKAKDSLNQQSGAMVIS